MTESNSIITKKESCLTRLGCWVAPLLPMINAGIGALLAPEGSKTISFIGSASLTVLAEFFVLRQLNKPQGPQV